MVFRNQFPIALVLVWDYLHLSKGNYWISSLLLVNHIDKTPLLKKIGNGVPSANVCIINVCRQTIKSK